MLASASVRFPRAYDAWRQLWPALGAGFVTALVAARGPSLTQKALQVAIAVGVVLVVAARPGAALAVLVAWMPVSLVALGLLNHYVAPVPVVRGLGAVKDGVTIGLLLAAAKARPKRAFDAIDWIAASYLALTVLYLLAPSVVPGLLGSQSFHVRLLAWRQNALFVGLFLAVRHAPIDFVWRRRIAGVVVAVGVLLSACALVEALAPTTWNHFMVNVAQVNSYTVDVLHGKVPDQSTVLTYEIIGGHRVERAGSLFANPITLPFYLVVPFALLVAALLRGRRTVPVAAALILVGSGIVLTITRSAYLGALAAIGAIAVLAVRRRSRGRIALALLVVLTALVVTPFVSGTSVARRVSTSGHSTDTSTHLSRSHEGLRVVERHPLGQGLGTSAGVGQAVASTSTPVIAENSYLQVADEIGVGAGVVFIALLVGAAVRLYRAAAADPEEWLATGAFGALAALMVAGLFLHVWLDYATSLTLWGAAGLALSRFRPSAVTGPDNADRAQQSAPQPVTT